MGISLLVVQNSGIYVFDGVETYHTNSPLVRSVNSFVINRLMRNVTALELEDFVEKKPIPNRIYVKA